MQFNGEGIQHIALLTDDLRATVDSLRAAGVPMMTPPPATYYEMLAERLPGHGEEVHALQSRGILIDGRHRRHASACCCRSSPGPCSAPSSSSSSSARATRASAKATSRRCSNRSSATRSAVA